MKKIIVTLLCIFVSLTILGCDFDSLTDRKYAKAKDIILAELHDPDSYEMEYKKYSSAETAVKIKFRANNRLGAKVIQYAYVGSLNDEPGLIYIGSKEDLELDSVFGFNKEK